MISIVQIITTRTIVSIRTMMAITAIAILIRKTVPIISWGVIATRITLMTVKHT